MKYLLLFILILVSKGFPQSESGEAFIKQILNNEIDYTEPSVNNSAEVLQIGNTNHTVINQSNTGFKSNNADAYQLGILNSSNINHSGTGNSSIVNQNGLYNSYNLELEGDHNRTLVFQNGINNSVNQEISGENLSYLIVQNGINNEIKQIENSPTSQPYVITQTGIGLRLEISNGNFIR